MAMEFNSDVNTVRLARALCSAYMQVSNDGLYLCSHRFIASKCPIHRQNDMLHWNTEHVHNKMNQTWTDSRKMERRYLSAPLTTHLLLPPFFPPLCRLLSHIFLPTPSRYLSFFRRFSCSQTPVSAADNQVQAKQYEIRVSAIAYKSDDTSVHSIERDYTGVTQLRWHVHVSLLIIKPKWKQ